MDFKEEFLRKSNLFLIKEPSSMNVLRKVVFTYKTRVSCSFSILTELTLELLRAY